MYQPAHFRIEDRDHLHGLMRAFPLASLVHRVDDGFEADPIPMMLFADESQHGVLRCHVARANPLWRHLGEGSPVLAIFRGGDAYVSPNWYASKAQDHKVVPTWNYEIVHAHGVARAIDDPAWLHRLVSELTDEMESAGPKPWAVSDAPPDYIAQRLRAIVGVEITLTRVEGKAKLSQNQPPANRASLAAGLLAGVPAHDEPAARAAMAARIRQAAPWDPVG